MQANKQQQRAIAHNTGPALILAGPGSGKTFTTVERVRYLIEVHHADPSHILVITFTKAAARQMRDRFFARMDNQFFPVTFGTFHAVFFHILKTSCHYNGSSILKEKEKREYLRAALLTLPKKFYAQNDGKMDQEWEQGLLSEIGFIKNIGKLPADFTSEYVSRQEFMRIFVSFQKQLAQEKKLDLDDFAAAVCHLFRTNPAELARWQREYSYLLVDEFQDINAAQYEAVKLLCGGKRNLFVVGDDDQAIYGFRGSDPAIMRQFLKDFPEAKQIFLSVNYRSRAGIVETAGKLIGQNRERFPKQIVAGQSTSDERQDVCFVPEATQGARRMQGEESTLPIPTGTASGISTAAFGTSWLPLSTDRSVLVCGFQDRRQEAETVADEIGKTLRQGKSCAAIFRTNADAVWLATALKCRNIPYLWKEKPKNPYETPVCQDLLAYLQFAMEGRKRKDFLRIMNRPCRYLSRQMLPDAEISFSALRRAYAQKPYMQEILHRLEVDISRLAKMDLYAAVHYIRRGMGYDAWLKENAGQTPSAGESRQGQERAPAGARAHAAGKLERDLEAADFFQEQAREFQSLTELEEAMTAYEDQMDQNMADAADTAASGTTGAAFTTLPIAELVTMHGSKGLEYDAVFLPCCMEGVVPHKKSKNQAALEEERRMFYVGMTRAKKELYLSYTKGTKETPGFASRFLAECGWKEPKR